MDLIKQYESTKLVATNLYLFHNSGMEDKDKKNISCPCGCSKVNKHGIRNGKQRYRCKECGHTFYDPNVIEYKYQRNTKRILSLLYNILEHDFFEEKDLEDALYKAKNYYKIASKIHFNTKYVKDLKDKGYIDISCYKPKLLICQDDKRITFIQIPSYTHTSKEDSRLITLNDNYFAWNAYSIGAYSKPFIKDNKKRIS